MFYGCSSLTQAPELPAVILYDFCYCAMFVDCPIPEPKYKMPNLTFEQVANKIQNSYMFGDSGGTYEIQCSDKILVATFDESDYIWIITEK
jgi:hypothetical protein